jgi:hypothetical protein
MIGARMPTLFDFEPAPDAPIVCDFTGAADTPGERLAEYARLFATSLVSRERTPSGVVLTFDPEAADQVTDLAAREAACCRFLSFRVTLDTSGARWEISGAPATQPTLDEFHAMFEEVATLPVEDLVARVGRGGIEVRLSDPVRR